MLVVADAIVRQFVEGRGFHLNTLAKGARDLQLGIEWVTEGASRRGKGRTADKLLKQWIWLATTAIEEATRRSVRVKQFQGDTRKPQLIGSDGEVLRTYVHLGSPNLSDATIVGVIVKQRRELRKPVS